MFTVNKNALKAKPNAKNFASSEQMQVQSHGETTRTFSMNDNR